MKKKCHICLVSAQTLPNLIPIQQERPDLVILLTSQEMEIQKERIQNIIKKWSIAFESLPVKPFDHNDIQDKCMGLIEKLSDGYDVTFNATGGTKLTVLYAYATFVNAGKRVIYLNTHDHEIREVYPKPLSIRVNDSLSVYDTLAAYGFTPLILPEDARKMQKVKERQLAVKQLATYLLNDHGSMKKLHAEVGDSKGKPFCNISLNKLGVNAKKLAELLSLCEVATVQSGNINIPSKEDKFFCGGGWFEEYVYQVVASVKGVRGIKINVTGKWDLTEKRKGDVTNEIDVIFIHRNQLHVISCKAGNLDYGDGAKGKNALYELDTLSKNIGGQFCKAMLVSARSARSATVDRLKAEAFKHICMVHGNEIVDLQKIIEGWINR